MFTVHECFRQQSRRTDPVRQVASPRRGRAALFLAAGVALAAAGLLACSETAPGVSKTALTAATASGPSVRTVRLDDALAERYGVRVEAAGSRGASHTIRAPGTLEYNLERYAEVGPLVEGRISSVTVRPGDSVKKGQRLATVLVPTIADAQAQLVASRAASGVAERNAKRQERLLEQNLTSTADAEAARGMHIEASAALSAAEARLRVLGAQVPKGQEIQAAGSVDLTAPIAGVVVRRDAVQGRYLRPAETAFVIADPSELWAHVDVFENDLSMLRPGDEAELHIDAVGRTIRGKVVTIEPQLGQRSRAARARIVVPNADGSLRAGLFVRAFIAAHGGPAERLRIPASAVQPLGNDDVVFVKREGGSYEVRTVKVTRTGTQLVEVDGGLERGEPIVVENAFLLRGEVTRQ